MVTLSKNPSVTVWELRYPQRVRKEAAEMGRGGGYRMYRMRTEEMRALKEGRTSRESKRVGGKSRRNVGRREEEDRKTGTKGRFVRQGPRQTIGVGFFRDELVLHSICKPCYFNSYFYS